MDEQQRATADDEIDLVELFRALWQGKWWIIAVTVVFAVGGVFYALAQPNQYQADALVAPATDGGGMNVGGNLGGLASMAGVDLGTAEAGMQQKVIATLQSRRFLIDFIKRHELKPQLLAVKKWDEQSREWVFDTERFDPETGEWKAPDPGERAEPSYLEAYRTLRDQLSVSRDDEGLVTLTLESQNPEAARQWLDWLIEDINTHVKVEEMASTRRNVEYLEQQLERTSVSGMRQVFFNLIEDQTQNLMLAELDEEYAFEVIDPPVVPEERSAPSRALIAILATMLGGMLSTFGVLVRYAFSSRLE